MLKGINLFKSFFLIALLASLFACGDKSNTPIKTLEKPYFDVKGFFEGETKRLTEGGMKIKKTVTVNGHSETKIIEKPNFEEEFKMFVASDINRPAWSDKYHIKRTDQSNHDYTTEYWAKDKNLKTQSMKIVQKYGDVYVTIDINNRDKSVVTESNSYLFYDKNNGFSITNSQQLVGFTDSVKIDVLFFKN
jgi:hypothetical protein